MISYSACTKRIRLPGSCQFLSQTRLAKLQCSVTGGVELCMMHRPQSWTPCDDFETSDDTRGRLVVTRALFAR